MTHYIKRGSEFDITDQANLDIRDHLPALYLWHREALAAKALYIRATGHGQFSTLREAENAKRALHNTRIPKFLHVDDLPSFELEPA